MVFVVGDDKSTLTFCWTENQNIWEIACVNRASKQQNLDADVDSV